MARLLSWLLSRLLGLLHLTHKEKELPQHVTDAVTHNIHHSFLHRLPLDILYYLATNHIPDPADLLALRATTRALRFSPIIHAPPPLLLRASRSFLFRLRRDEFTRACAAEHHERAQQQQQRQQRYPAPPQRAVCSVCIALHPRADFTPAQLARAPEKRRCRGTDGTVRLCPHIAYTFNQLRRLRAQGRAGADPWRVRVGYTLQRKCWECVPRVPRQRGGWEPEEPGAQLVGMTIGCFRGDGWQREFYVAERSLVIGESGMVVGVDGGEGGSVVVKQSTRFTRELVFRVLKTVAEQRRDDVFVCAHVRLDDPATFDTTLVDYYFTISEHKCRAGQGCNVRVYLRWDHHPRRQPFVELKIKRFFDVESPYQKQWLGQIEKLAEE